MKTGEQQHQVQPQQAPDLRAVWQRPELRRLEAGSAEAGGTTTISDGATFS